MKAMILAAGKGTRLRPLTRSIPKPMIPLLGKPVMESIIEHLRAFGVSEIVVNTSFLAPMIQSYFGDGGRYGVQIGYSFEGEIVDGEITGTALGSAGGMRRIQDFSGFFDDTFLVVCGDALIDFDIVRAVDFHRASGSLATIVLKEVPADEVSKYGIVELDDSGRILRFQEKPDPADAVSRMANTGIYVFEPEIFQWIPAHVEYDIGSQLFPALVEAGVPFYGISMPFQWVDIGSIHDYWVANRLILGGQVRDYEMPGREVSPGIWCGINQRIDFDRVNITPPVYIASGVEIGDGATVVGPSVIGANSRLAPGAEVRESIIGEYVHVRGAARIEGKLIIDGNCIEPDGSYLDIAETGVHWLIDDARVTREFGELERLLVSTIDDIQ